MIDGNASDFIDMLSYEDHYALFCGKKYFLNGCQTQTGTDGHTVIVRLEVYCLTDHTTVYSTSQKNASDCLTAFQAAKIWNGKSFWEAESEITWVDA